jgi:hypothetical protein
MIKRNIRAICGSLRFQPSFALIRTHSRTMGILRYLCLSAQSVVLCVSSPHSRLFARIRGPLWFHSRFTADGADKGSPQIAQIG